MSASTSRRAEVSSPLSRSAILAHRLVPVALYAVAMAYVEAAVVVYLRAVYGIHDLVVDAPIALDSLTYVELGREVATIVMLLAVGWVAGRRWLSILAYAVYAFGIWDIWYYVWLHVMLGWPASVLDWDILFLIPVQWWGPVLAPGLIAALMSATGGFVAYRMDGGMGCRLRRSGAAVLALGCAVVLYTFWADALAALPYGAEALLHVKPTVFQWPLFLAGYALMVAGGVASFRWEREPAVHPQVSPAP